MRDPRMVITGLLLRGRNRLIGLDVYGDPRSYFGPGGLQEAEARCTEANRDLLAFVRPPAAVEPAALRRDRVEVRADGVRVEDWSFDSPCPSGCPTNDRVRFRLYAPPLSPEPRRVVLFHHPVYQRRWGLWSWFFAGLIRRVPVAMLAGPHHFERTAPGRFPGEGTVNPNPARMYESIRQWCWDHQGTVRALTATRGLDVVAEVGYSLGAFQMLLLAAAGRIDVPLASIAATNRYAYGLSHGVIGKGLLRSMRTIGIDEHRLFELTDAVQLERYASRLHGKPVLSIRGTNDWVDPPPSLDRLEQALQPKRSLKLYAGHGTLLLHRRLITREITDFFEAHDALPPHDRRARHGSNRPNEAET